MLKIENLNNCFCEATLKNFIALENKGYKRSFNRPYDFHDILIISKNEINVFERKDISNYANGSYLNREITYEHDINEFIFVNS